MCSLFVFTIARKMVQMLSSLSRAGQVTGGQATLTIWETVTSHPYGFIISHLQMTNALAHGSPLGPEVRDFFFF